MLTLRKDMHAACAHSSAQSKIFSQCDTILSPPIVKESSSVVRRLHTTTMRAWHDVARPTELLNSSLRAKMTRDFSTFTTNSAARDLNRMINILKTLNSSYLQS